MCGINGIFAFKADAIDPGLLTRMNQSLHHRGPDDEGSFRHGDTSVNVELGFRRLAIIDLSGGHQPMTLGNRLTIVFNGEIYNFAQLRASLIQQGRAFSSQSDTEVILHLYDMHGAQCLEHLRGMFAFAIWDHQRQSLFIARDRIGKKPLYYAQVNNTFYFSSEIKALAQVPAIGKEIETSVIPYYLAYQFIPGEQTIFKKIRRLNPAHYMYVDKSGAGRAQRYWQIARQPKWDAPLGELCRQLREQVEEATVLRLRADVPLGAFLSGGIDSGAIVAMMAKHSTRPVKTFCVGFNPSDAELKYAAITAKKFGTQHQEIIVSPAMTDILPKLAWHYDQPFADPSALPSYYVAQATRQYVTVALNGDGGDENFGGYLRYQADYAFTFLQKMPQSWRHWACALAKQVPSSWQQQHLTRRLVRAATLLDQSVQEFNYKIFCYFDQAAQQHLLKEPLAQQVHNQDPYSLFKNLYAQTSGPDWLDPILDCDQNAYLPDCLLVKMDIASMANSLEARSPLLDHKLIEWAARLPSHYKVHLNDTKWIFKQAFKDILPPEILTKRKTGFGIPLAQWLRGEMKDFVRDHLLGKAKSLEFFNRAEVERLINEHQKNEKDHGYKLWALLMFELWYQQY